MNPEQNLLIPNFVPLTREQIAATLLKRTLKTEVIYIEEWDAYVEIKELNATTRMEIAAGMVGADGEVDLEGLPGAMIKAAAYGLGLEPDQVELLESNPQVMQEVAQKVLGLSGLDSVAQAGESAKNGSSVNTAG